MNLGALWAMFPGFLRRRGWLIALILALGLPAVYFVVKGRPLVYQATAVIQIEAPQVAANLTGQPVSVQVPNRVELIEQKLMSRDSLLAVIDELDLFSDTDGEPPSATEQIAILRASTTIVKLVDQSQAWRPDVQPSGLAITVQLDDPDKAAAVANAFLDSIMAEAQLRAEGRASRTLEFFAAEEARVESAIATLEEEVARFKESSSGSLPEALTSQREQITRLTDSRIAMDQQIIQLQTGSDRLRPEELARQTALLEQQRALILRNIAEIQAAIAAAPEVERRITVFDRQLAQLQDEFRMVTARRTEAAMNQLLETQHQSEQFEVLETAIPPEFPLSSSRRKLAAAGGLAVGMMAIGLALLLEMMNPVIRTAAQMERHLGVQPVVVIPVLRRPRWTGGRLLWLGAIVAMIAAAALVLRGRWADLAGQIPFLQRTAPEPEPVPVLQSRRRARG